METRTIGTLEATAFPLGDLPGMWAGTLQDVAGQLLTETDPLDSKAAVFSALEAMDVWAREAGE